ncbi:alanine racemase [Microbacterium sp. NPDC091313]
MTTPARQSLIDPARITANVAAIVAAVTPAQLLVVVKADGYGHGAVTAATAALQGGASWLGVADISEALELRRAGIAAPVLAWLHADLRLFPAAVAADVTLAISHARELRAATEAGAGVVHIKIDSGLHRNGAPIDEWAGLFDEAARAERCGGPRVAGMFTHLSNASEAENRSQLDRFDDAVRLARSAGLDPTVRHIGGTHAALTVARGRYELVRVGIGAYGLRAEQRTPVAGVGLRPAMRLSSVVSSVRPVRAGSGVSYDYAFRADADGWLALVPFGYADGLPRQASGSSSVSIGGRRYRVAGRIAMDQLVVATGADQRSPGEHVVLWGDGGDGAPTADEWADWAGTIGYELVTRIGRRVERVVGAW